MQENYSLHAGWLEDHPGRRGSCLNKACRLLVGVLGTVVFVGCSSQNAKPSDRVAATGPLDETKLTFVSGLYTFERGVPQDVTVMVELGAIDTVAGGVQVNFVVPAGFKAEPSTFFMPSRLAKGSFTAKVTATSTAFTSKSYELRAISSSAWGTVRGTSTKATVQSYNFRKISAGGDHSCAITATNRLYCFGSNFYGQIGTTSKVDEPINLVSNDTFLEVSAGDAHTCAITTERVLFCWGKNDSGQLGDGTTDRSNAMKQVAVPDNAKFDQVSAGKEHTCAITIDGKLYCWGENSSGQLGIGTNKSSLLPKEVIVPGVAFSKVSAGGGHTCAIAVRSDQLFCWGKNSSGQLGIGTNKDENTPQKVNMSSPASSSVTFSVVTTGDKHTCAINSDGETACWGSSEYGQLGNGLTDYNTPQVITKGFIQIDAGLNHTCAINTKSSAFCWGLNEDGQLGIGKSGPREHEQYIKRVIGFDSKTTMISAGGKHTLSLSSISVEAVENNAFAWGSGLSGQLGTGTLFDYDVPTLILD